MQGRIAGTSVGPVRLGDIVLDLSPDALAARLAAPDAS
jgi:hypothetical protein